MERARRGGGAGGYGPAGWRAVAAVAVALLAVGMIATLAFGLSFPLLLALLPVALLLSAASARAAGETDQAPVGQVGSVVQLGMGGAGVVPTLAAGALVRASPPRPPRPCGR